MTLRKQGVLVAVVALVLDQLSKNLLLYGFNFRELGPAAHIDITSFLDLVMVWNRGVSYGLFQADDVTGTVLLTVFSLVAVAFLSWWLKSAERRFLAVGLGLVIGGALGNVIDRLIYGAVADFFHFHAFGHDWYVFNVADAAISVGVALLLIDAFVREEGANADREPCNPEIDMVRKHIALRMASVTAVLMAGAALIGCSSLREATGATKQPPDEFTVLTKSPLVIPPDYNLRPPQPGVASRNELDADSQAQTALFPTGAAAAAALGDNYSDGEKLLLSKSNALTVDPNIRRNIGSDVGQEDQGPEFSQKVLFEGAMPAAGAAGAPAMPGAATMDQPPAPPPAEEKKGFFGRVFGPRSETTPVDAKRIRLAANMPAGVVSDVPLIQLAADTSSSDEGYFGRLFTRKRQPDRRGAPPAAETPPPAPAAAAPAGSSAPASSAQAVTPPPPKAAPAGDPNAPGPNMRKREARNMFELLSGVRQGGNEYEPIPPPAPPPPPPAPRVVAAPPPKPPGPPEAKNLYELVSGRRQGETVQASSPAVQPQATPAVQKTPESNAPEEKKGWFSRIFN